MKILDDYPLEVIPKNVTNGDILKLCFQTIYGYIYTQDEQRKNGGTHHMKI